MRRYMIRFFVNSKKYGTLFLLLVVCLSCPNGFCGERHEAKNTIGMAVEFMDHAAAAYVALDKGWFKREGLHFLSYKNYVTGMALSSALARGDIQVAYICLIPAINAYANAKVSLKVIAGTHWYGYGLVVNPEKIQRIKDLEKPGIRIGCVREGGPVDVLLHKTMDTFGLEMSRIAKGVQRMPPPTDLLAIRMGRLDAAFAPEQWASMAEDCGFKMLLTAQEVWPGMQGSVLVVKEDLIRKYPGMVEALVKVTEKATAWVNQHPRQTSRILSRQLSVQGEKHLLPGKFRGIMRGLAIPPRTLLRSMSRMQYRNDVDPCMVQKTIDYMAKLGYIERGLKAEDILDLRFVK